MGLRMASFRWEGKTLFRDALMTEVAHSMAISFPGFKSHGGQGIIEEGMAFQRVSPCPHPQAILMGTELKLNRSCLGPLSIRSAGIKV